MHARFYRPVSQSQPDTVDEWKAVLNLTTMWKFEDSRALAIEKLDSLLEDPLDKIHLAQRYHIPGWVPAALEELVQRAQPLSMSEATRLGFEWTVKLAEIRECAVVGEVQNPSSALFGATPTFGASSPPSGGSGRNHFFNLPNLPTVQPSLGVPNYQSSVLGARKRLVPRGERRDADCKAKIQQSFGSSPGWVA